MKLGFKRAKFIVGGNDFAPDAPVELGEGFGRGAFDEEFTGGEDCHARAQLTNIVDDLRGENNGAVAADGERRFRKRLRSAGSRPAVGSLTMRRRGSASSA